VLSVKLMYSAIYIGAVAAADGGWPGQLVAWVAQQREEHWHNRLDIIEDLLAFGHRQFLPVPPVKG
jgi:hypothetical protein